MKVYDKEIYTKQESIKTTAIMILVFLIGFIAGYLANSFSNNSNTSIKNEITELIIPSVNIKDRTEVNNTINELIKSTTYIESTTDKKIEDVNNLLKDLKKQKKINDYSFNETNKIYSFTYSDGTLGGILIEDFNSELN